MGRVPLPAVEDLDPDTLAKMGHIPHNSRLFSRVHRLAGHMSSKVAGCRFCWAYTANNATHQIGTDPRTFEEIWNFETSPTAHTTFPRVRGPVGQLPVVVR